MPKRRRLDDSSTTLAVLGKPTDTSTYDNKKVSSVSLSQKKPHPFKEVLWLKDSHWNRSTTNVGAVPAYEIGHVTPFNLYDPMGTFAVGPSGHHYNLKHLTGGTLPLYNKAKAWASRVTFIITFNSLTSALNTWLEKGLYFVMWVQKTTSPDNEFGSTSASTGSITEHYIRNGEIKHPKHVWKYMPPVRTTTSTESKPFKQIKFQTTVYAPEILDMTRKEYQDATGAPHEHNAASASPYVDDVAQATANPSVFLKMYSANGTNMDGCDFDVLAKIETNIVLYDQNVL